MTPDRFATMTTDELRAECRRLDALINTPEIHDFMSGAALEAAHQIERWPPGHDAGKSDADWFWLIGYLAGKALHNPSSPDGRSFADLKLHRIITVAAAAANWHAHAVRAIQASRVST